MEIEVLAVPGCPHRAEALARVRDALTATGAAAVVSERVITSVADATAAGMNGSPTVLVDGRDPFAEGPVEPSLSCRLYRSRAGVEGAPAVGALVDALRDAEGGRS